MSQVVLNPTDAGQLQPSPQIPPHLLSSLGNAFWRTKNIHELFGYINSIMDDKLSFRSRLFTLTGPDHVGKSRALRELKLEYPSESNDYLGTHPVVVCKATASANPWELAEAIVLSVKADARFAYTTPRRAANALAVVLDRLETRLLVINRAQYLSHDGRCLSRQMSLFLDDLITDGNVSVCLAGNEELEHVLKNSSKHLHTSIDQALILAPLPWAALGGQWSKLLSEIVGSAPIDMSILNDDDIGDALYYASNGMIPVLSSIINSAAHNALQYHHISGSSHPVEKTQLLASDLEVGFAHRDKFGINPFQKGWRKRLGEAQRKEAASFTDKLSPEVKQLIDANRTSG